MRWTTVFLRDVSWDEVERETARLVERVKQDRQSGFLFCFEPSPTFTYGRNADPAERIWNDDEAARRGITVRAADRGGKWTYHGPGQVIAFPIFDLAHLGFARTEVRRLLDSLRSSTETYLSSVGIEVDRCETPFGLYVSGAKLVSFGIAVHDGICRHGLSLYLRDPAENFSGILSCGVKAERFTSLETLGVKADWESVADGLSRSLANLKKVLN